MKRPVKKRVKNLLEFSYDDALQKLFVAANVITNKLTEDLRKLMDLEETEPFPEVWARQVRAAIASGLADWAVRRMGTNIDKLLDEGVRNFLDMFWLASMDPNRDRPWGKGERFKEGMKKARFLIPLTFTRTVVHPRDWPELREAYRDALDGVKKLQGTKRRSRGNYLLALRESLPGISDKQIEIFSLMKPSDIAAEYVCWKFKLAAGPETLKKNFKVFHKRYGYMDHVIKRINRVK